MGTTLTGTTPQDTYDSLIKVTDNGPLSATAKYLSDGLGNDSALALSTSRVGVGTNSPTSKLTIANGTANDYTDGIVMSKQSGNTYAIYASTNDLEFRSVTAGVHIATFSYAGNVGIGTSSPAARLDVMGTNNQAISGKGQLFIADGGTAAQAAGEGGQLSFGAWLNGDLSAPYPMATLKGISEVATTNQNQGALIIGTAESSSLVVERVRITSENYLRLAAGGIQFNGDTAAANALDDYEEGTWTATLKGDVSDPTTPVTTTATYTKIGRQVTLRGEFVNVNTSGASGIVNITGVPFLSSAQNTGSVMLFNFDLNTSTAQNCYIGASVSYLEFYGQKDDAAWVQLLHIAGAGRYLIFSITYFV